MQSAHDTSDEALAADAAAMAEAIRDGRLDEAEAMLESLRPLVEEPAQLLVFSVVIAIQRGQPIEALRLLDGQDPRHAAPLQAMLLQLLGDPSWEGPAREAMEASPDAHVRLAMRQLCGLPPEAA